MKHGRMRLFYWLFHTPIRWFFLRYYRLRVVGLDRLPRQGGFILASNHVSHLDPPAIGVAVHDREIYYMAKASLFKIPVFGWGLHGVNALPVQRGQGPDQDWQRYIRPIQRGGVLVVFPEGTRSPDGQLQRGKSGFARLVHMVKAPVYPAYVQGSFTAAPKSGPWRRAPITVTFGDAVPLDDLYAVPEDKRILRQISGRVMEAIARLKAESGSPTAEASGAAPC